MLVGIHPWNEANTRTAHALASWILLRAGYLPPVIKDREEYKRVLMEGFGKEDGYKVFVDYIVSLIEKTQQQFQGQQL